jgi:O-antigen/teichoic acid export membrane protein
VLEEIKKLLKHGSVYSLGNILNKAVGFLLIPFYTHYLTTADYGTLELLDLSVALIGLLLNMWMNASLVRHYYEYEDSKNRNEVVSTALIATASVAAVVSLFALLWAREISDLILKSPQYFRFIRVIACNLFFTCVNSVSFSYLRARQRSSAIVAMNTLCLVVGLFLNIYLLAVVKTGVIGILYSSLTANILVTTVLTVITIRQVGLHLDLIKFKVLAAFGLPLIVTSFSAFELNFADRFFLQHYSNVSTVGVYALGYKFGFMLSFLLIQPFMMIWGARMYEVAKRADAGPVFSKIAGYFTLLMCAVALAMSLVIKNVISLVAAPQFHDAYRVVPLVALSYVFYGLSYYFQSGMYISKKTHYLGLMGAICAAANVGFNFLLIPRFAAMGAACATALSFLLMAVLAYFFSQRAYHIPYALFKILVPLAAAVGAYCLATLIDVASIPVSLMLKGFVFIGFGIVILLSGFLEKSEIFSLRRVAGGMWGRFGSAGNGQERMIEP